MASLHLFPECPADSGDTGQIFLSIWCTYWDTGSLASWWDPEGGGCDFGNVRTTVISMGPWSEYCMWRTTGLLNTEWEKMELI